MSCFNGSLEFLVSQQISLITTTWVLVPWILIGINVSGQAPNMVCVGSQATPRLFESWGSPWLKINGPLENLPWCVWIIFKRRYHSFFTFWATLLPYISFQSHGKILSEKKNKKKVWVQMSFLVIYATIVHIQLDCLITHVNMIYQKNVGKLS